MPRARHTILATALLAAAAACAHAPVKPAREEVVWPAPPDAPRARLAALLPDPDAPAPRPPWWRRVVAVIVGHDPDPAESLLARPFGIAAANGAVFVADPDAPSVLRIDGPRAARVECRDLAWSAPMGIAVAEDGTLYVADGGSATVVVVEPGGKCRSLGAGALERPVSVALDGGRLLVADPPRHQIVVLSLAGDVLARWGTEGEGDGEFHFPTAVARAPDGMVLVVDALNFRVARLSAEGAWLGAFGVPGETEGSFARPKAVAADARGRVYVSDAQRDAVLVFRADGAFEFAVGTSGSAPGYFALPAGLAVSGGRLVVADSMNRRIQVFELLGDPP
jgi:DNA-binding beta-propeller fold protein YncE